MGGSTRMRRVLARTGVALAVVTTAAVASPLAAGAARGGVPDGPDYVITSVNNPPVTAAPGGSFTLLDTTKNQGNADATATSQNLYYLSPDNELDATDTVLGGRGILALTAGETSSGGLNAHVPATMPLGDYFVITCADGSNNVAEVDETNNCASSTTQVSIVLPDYKVTTLTEPPAAGQRGKAFTIFDTTKNIGRGDGSADAYTDYYFSKNPKLDEGDFIIGGRGMFGLAAHKASTGGLNAHVPSTITPGQYFLLACADDTHDTTEANEANNCMHSAGKTTVTVPDYYVPSVSTPPAQATRGAQISYSAQVRNKGGDAPFTTVNAYYLSKDTVVDASDVQFAVMPEISPLRRGQSVFDGEELVVPSNAKLGFFHIIVCADAANVLGEADETNNCRASVGKVQIVRS
jgi:subtilase family serine protease